MSQINQIMPSIKTLCTINLKVLTMQAIQINQHGGLDVLKLVEIAKPSFDPTKVLVRVAYAGLNFVDIYQREGRYPGSSLPMILGIEASGLVEHAPISSRFKTGQRVAFASGAQGAYAEYVSVPDNALVLVPNSISLADAATVLEHGLTADMLLKSVTQIENDQPGWAVVHAAAGGVGRWLVRQLIEQGINVVGVVSNDAKCNAIELLGAKAIRNDQTTPWHSLVLQATNGEAPRWIFDSVGASTFDDSLSLLKQRGHLVLFGAASGPVASVEIARIMAKSATLTRPVLPHFISDPAELTSRANRVFRRVSEDQSWSPPTKRFLLSEARAAHQELTSRERQGKLLFEISPE
jgi:NADPH:quinone reductase